MSRNSSVCVRALKNWIFVVKAAYISSKEKKFSPRCFCRTELEGSPVLLRKDSNEYFFQEYSNKLWPHHTFPSSEIAQNMWILDLYLQTPIRILCVEWTKSRTSRYLRPPKPKSQSQTLISWIANHLMQTWEIRDYSVEKNTATFSAHIHKSLHRFVESFTTIVFWASGTYPV